MLGCFSYYLLLCCFFAATTIIVFFFDVSRKIFQPGEIKGPFNALKTGVKGGNQAKTASIYGKIKL